jgi:aminocarboxymuconate-semialdehyde decarboxylase
MTLGNRIDVHQHVIPPFYADELPSHGGDPSGGVLPLWTPEDALAFMDSQGIDAALLSLTAPGLFAWYKLQRRGIARRINNFTASVVERWPARFGNLATIPLPEVLGAVREIRHAFNELDADGISLFSSYQGRYLGDRAFDPVWAELDHHKATVLIKPSQPPCPVLPGVMGMVVDYPYDITRTAVHMVLNGVLERYPNVRVILSDGGGFTPYVAERAAHLSASFNANVSDPQRVLRSLRSFYFDTAMIGGSALASLLQFAGSDRILFGTAFPSASSRLAATFAEYTVGLQGFSNDDLAAVFRQNAQALFPRLSARLGKGRARGPLPDRSRSGPVGLD